MFIFEGIYIRIRVLLNADDHVLFSDIKGDLKGNHSLLKLLMKDFDMKIPVDETETVGLC